MKTDESSNQNNGGNNDGQNNVPFDLNVGNSTPTDEAAKLAEAKAVQEAEAKKKAEADAKNKADEEAKKKAEEEAKLKAAANGGKGADDDAPTGVEIEGVQYAFDKDGNAIDKDGKVFKTKEEVDALIAADAEEDNEIPLVTEVGQTLGFKILDEQGKEKVYEDSVEGIVSLVKDAAAYQNEQDRKEFFEAYPEAKEIVEHIKKGGKPEDFYKRKLESWMNVSLEGADEAGKMNVVIKDLLSKGFNEKDAKETAELYKDSGKLDEKSTAALKSQQEAEAKAEKDRKAEQARIAKEEEAAAIKSWKAVEETVNKGVLDSFIVPEADKKGFFEYISKAQDENGNSKAALDRFNLPLEKKLLLDYLVYKQLDVNALVKMKGATRKVLSLRERVAREKGNPGANAHQQNINQGNGLKEDVTINDIIPK